VVFFARSLLSPVVYSSTFPSTPTSPLLHLDVVKEIQQVYSVSHVLCKADPILVSQRLGGRYTFASDEDKVLLQQLGETDSSLQQEYDTRFNKLEEWGLFDAQLPTTSTKQATANILAMLNIKPTFDFKFSSPPPPNPGN